MSFRRSGTPARNSEKELQQKAAATAAGAEFAAGNGQAEELPRRPAFAEGPEELQHQVVREGAVVV